MNVIHPKSLKSSKSLLGATTAYTIYRVINKPDAVYLLSLMIMRGGSSFQFQEQFGNSFRIYSDFLTVSTVHFEYICYFQTNNGQMNSLQGLI